MKGEPYHYNQKAKGAKKLAQFATGMNGDEDLGEDIIMKGEPYHYNQKKPENHQLFATGMNGDEDLAQDIIMKGEPYHYNQKLAQWNPVVVETTGKLPACHGNNGPDGVNCAREVCSGTNGPVDGPSGTPCTKEEPDAVPHYNTDPTAGRPYQTSGDITATSPEATSAHSWPASQTLVQTEDDAVPSAEAEKVSVLQTPYGHTHTSFY